MRFGNDTTICHSKSGQIMKVLEWFILHVKSKWTYIKCTVQNGSFCTQKQLNIHQMYGSERFILHVNDMNFLNGSERFRTVHELSDFWQPFPKERFRTAHLFGCPSQMNGSERIIVFLIFCPTSPLMMAVAAMQHQIHIIARALPVNRSAKEPWRLYERPKTSTYYIKDLKNILYIHIMYRHGQKQR